ncbi:hypothetical protein EXIGLDRAFT_761241 [Exidia glandulosa HHB12029]|uniref:DUF6535 domain-containing protein n=1 Tax=Exidia glandulosa HHB12029 TaxID=1314781 RepID=A0A165NMF5_EXIGL|nr:hypothetical protein EXIGLDRAFT_761241 [Exidia glandulosa HHB12029]
MYQDYLQGYSSSREHPSDHRGLQKEPIAEALGSEIDDDARVWHLYRQEVTEYDKKTLENWNSTVDVVLVFAGLFSAVVTAFLVDAQSIVREPPDCTQEHVAYTARALHALIVLSTNGSTTPVSMLGLPTCTDKQISGPDAWDFVVYVLWVLSLLLALFSALLGMCHKFWLSEYQGRTTAGAHHARYWAIRHLFFSVGLHTNPLGITIEAQQLVLHLAVGLFTIGFFMSVLNTVPPFGGVVMGGLLAYAGRSVLKRFIEKPDFGSDYRNLPTSIPSLHIRLLNSLLGRNSLAWFPWLDRMIMRGANFATQSLHMYAEDPAVRAYIEARSLKHLAFDAARRLLASTTNRSTQLAVLHIVCSIHPLSRATLELANVARTQCTPTRFLALSMTVMSTPDDIARTITTYVVIWGGEYRFGLGAGLPSSAGEVLQASERPELSLFGAAMNMDLAHIRRHAVDWRQRAANPYTFGVAALTLTRLRCVSLSAVLHFLLCVDFSVLEEVDWLSIFPGFRTLLARTPPRLGWYAQRLSELLAELLYSKTLSAEDSEVVETLISNLLEETELWPETAVPHISPFLVAYIASTAWLERSCSPCALRTLTDILTRWKDWAMLSPSTASTAFGAMTNVVRRSIRAQGMGEDGRTYIVASVALAIAVLVVGPANFSPASVLRHIDAPPGEPANLLQMLFALDPGNRFLPRPVEVLAAVLPPRSRTEASHYDGALVETFFSSVSFAHILRTLFEKGRKQYDSSAYAQFKHIAQHCIELKPTWWSTFLRAADVEGDSDIELREFVFEMGVEVERLGPCTLHGAGNAPVDWNAPCFEQE